MLNRSTRTIVEQVAALKSMVDAFSQYARSPEPKLQWLDLNQVTREVLGLYESLGRRMDLRLAPDLPLVQGDARLLRQVFHNLMQNAQDALARGRRAADRRHERRHRTHRPTFDRGQRQRISRSS